MRINGKILIAIIGFVFVAGAGLGLSKLGGFALIKEFYSRNAAHQVTAADVAKDVQAMKTAADVAKDVQAMKHETKLPKTLDDYTELVDIRADGRAVVFVHRLTFAANPSKAYEFLAAVRTDMLQRACSNNGMPKAMNEGVVFRYQYADSVGFNVGSFDIGGNDCAGA
jgi:urease gamma subunit